MKRLKHFSSVFWLILVTSLALTLAGCDTPIATPVSTTTPVQDTPTAQTPATIRGIITYQAPPTPTSMLYLSVPSAGIPWKYQVLARLQLSKYKWLRAPTNWWHSRSEVRT